MGWYIRKPFTLGRLLRLNLSKSGLGFSFGVKGARIGTGPRGNYVHLGRRGLYYRQSLPSFDTTRKAGFAGPSPPAAVPEPEQEIQVTTADVSALKDHSAQQLLSEIQQKHRIVRVAPIVASSFALAIVLLLIEQSPMWLPVGLLVVGGIVCFRLAQYDRRKKTVILHFELDDSMRAKYASLVGALKSLASCSMLWSLSSQQSVRDPKYCGGAGTVVSKKRASLELGPPPFVETEILVWHLKVGNQTFYFFPDRILVYQGNNVGVVSYSGIRLTLSQVRFIENSQVPADASVVDHTWRYTNRGGGPDRRFAYNPTIPVVQYAEIQFSSSTGVNVLLQASNLQKASAFTSGVTNYVQDMLLSHTNALPGNLEAPQSGVENCHDSTGRRSSFTRKEENSPKIRVPLSNETHEETNPMTPEMINAENAWQAVDALKLEAPKLVRTWISKICVELRDSDEDALHWLDNARRFILSELFTITTHFSCLDGRVSPGGARVGQAILGSLDPLDGTYESAEFMMQVMQKLFQEDSRYSTPLEKPFTLKLIEGKDLAVAEQARDLMFKLALAVTLADGSLNSSKKAELASFGSALGYDAGFIVSSIPGGTDHAGSGTTFCMNCGHKNPSDARFCSQCGKERPAQNGVQVG